MSVLPVDSIVVEIEAQLTQLQQQMDEANRIIERGTEKMKETTKRNPLLGGQAEFSRVKAGVLGTIVGIASLKFAVDAVAEGFERWRRPVDIANESVRNMVNTLTFGMQASVERLMLAITGIGRRAALTQTEFERRERGQLQVPFLRFEQRQLELQTMAATELNPIRRAGIQLLIATRAAEFEEQQRLANRIPATVAAGLRSAQVSAAEVEQVTGFTGGRVVNPELLELMREIARNTRDQGPQ